MRRLKYTGYSVVMQEVPNEISIAFNISGCPHRCEGCHSKYLWEYTGRYLLDDIESIIDKYKGLVTCVCFMGGDQNTEELLVAINLSKERELKTCMYTGIEKIDDVDEQLIKSLDYLKTGRYIQKLGGLNCKSTNQKMYDLKNDKEIFFYD